MVDINVDYWKKGDKEIKDIFKLHNLTQIINKPTRITNVSKTLNDTIFTSNTLNVSFSDVFNMGIADHDLTVSVRKFNTIKYKQKTIRCRNYKNYSHREM